MDSEKITFYTDEDIDGPAIRWARKLGVQIVTANEAGNMSADDPIHFDYAVEHGYVIVTGNVKDYEPLFYEFAASGDDHPGMVLIDSDIRNSSGYIAEELYLYFEASTPAEMKNRLVRIKG